MFYEGKRARGLTENMLSESNLNSLRLLQEMAHSRGQSMAQMALSWLLKDRRVTSVLIGASRPQQLEENVQALKNLTFSAEELAQITVLAAEAAPGRPAYDIGGGFNKASISFEARYALTDTVALLGEVLHHRDRARVLFHVLDIAGDDLTFQRRVQRLAALFVRPCPAIVADRAQIDEADLERLGGEAAAR